MDCLFLLQYRIPYTLKTVYCSQFDGRSLMFSAWSAHYSIKKQTNKQDNKIREIQVGKTTTLPSTAAVAAESTQEIITAYKYGTKKPHKTENIE